MNGRSVLFKHKSYALYHPSAYYLASIAADIPLRIIQILLFSNVFYWLVGLNDLDRGGRFGTFLFILFIASK